MFNFTYITPKEATKIFADKSIKYYAKLAKIDGKCSNCENNRWKLVNNNLCFGCTTGETDASLDYELKET